jgi:hypothetical protein
MNIDLKELNLLIEQKYISVQKHKDASLYIYNYTPQTQFERYWTGITLQCRGLILNENGAVAARPFRKFFNLEEHRLEEIPQEPFEVYEKLDGSMGILYWLNKVPFIASRGSFHSQQAQKASRLLHTKYTHILPYLRQEVTYLFEIIYPQNRIVVNYGAAEELILLAIIDNHTGLDLPLENIGFPLVQRFDGISDLQKLKALNHPNKEGFVLKFRSSFRVKVKFEEYVRLHRILTGVSNKMIWEMLRNNTPMDAILERVPDEFYDWVKKNREELMQEYTAIEAYCKNDFKELGDRKSTAMYYLTCKYPSILFAMLDKRDYSDSIWKLIKPKYEKPFAKEEGQ